MNDVMRALRNHPFRIAFAILLLVGALFGVRQLTGYQELTIEQREPASGVTKIYQVKDKPDTSPAALIDGLNGGQEVTGSTTLRMRKGTYVVVGGSASPDFTRQLEKVTLDNEPVTVVINPPYSSEKLASLLDTARPAIHAAVKQAVPKVDNSYLLAPGQLYGKGEWYGSVLYPNLSPEQRRLSYVDSYRIVVKKEGDSWKVVTVPPEIVLSTLTYPQIPKGVLISTNNQKVPN
jgi:hypothetical protein